jgi:S-(hydroxymethyl)glutathione dehydrogenase / alcohol dehydrogenase
MRGAVFTGPHRPLEIEHLDLAEPRRDEVTVRMLASGVCRSDLHVVDGDWTVTPPVVMGHEGFAEIEAVGEGVTELAPGDRVTLSWFATCGHCRHCAAGRVWLCGDSRSYENALADGTTRITRADGTDVFPYLGVGTFGERGVVPAKAAVPMPVGLPAEVGALIGCAVATGVGAAMNTARLEPGSSVVVIGCGGVGLSVIMGAALCGADPIIALDISDEKLETARDLGATHGVRAGDGARREILKLTGGGPDYVFEALGNVATLNTMLDLMPRGGTAVIVGMTAENQTIGFDPFTFADASRTVVGCNYGWTQPAVDFPRLGRLHLAGKLPVDRMVSERIVLDDVNSAFDRMRSGDGARRVILY